MTPLFRTIVVGVDGAAGGADAAALAQRFIAEGTTLVLAHAHEPRTGGAQAREIVRAARASVGGDAVLVDRPARSVPKFLHEVAADMEADLIVLGSPNPRDEASKPLADLPAIVHHSPCSVAVAPRGYAQSTGVIASIGVGFRDALHAQLATSVARRIGEQLKVPVHALGVLQQTPSPWRGPALGTLDAVQSITGNDEQELRNQLAAQPDLHASVVHGEPVEQLRAFAEQHDLLVIGAPGRGAMRRLVVGSAATGLLGLTSCPLLIVGGERPPAA